MVAVLWLASIVLLVAAARGASASAALAGADDTLVSLLFWAPVFGLFSAPFVVHLAFMPIDHGRREISVLIGGFAPWAALAYLMYSWKREPRIEV